MAKEKAKHQYNLIANKLCDDVWKYTYNYSSTKGIELLLCETGFAINISVASLYDKDYMLASDSYLFPDAIRKALLLYLLKFSKSLQINSITTKIDDIEETTLFPDPANPPIYSMINGDLLRTIPTAFSDDTVFNHLLNTPKSKYDKRIASLFAFLYSKSKEYATERFIYLWTAFNGMYCQLSEFVTTKGKKKPAEYKQITAFLKYYNLGNETIGNNEKWEKIYASITPLLTDMNKNEKKNYMNTEVKPHFDADNSRIAGTVMSILKDFDISLANREEIEKSDINTRIKNTLKTKLNDEYKEFNTEYNITTYGYLLTQLSYYFRCKIVHGNKPLLLFSYSDDRELHSLQIINALLEEFIDNNMPLLFDDKYINEVIIPKAQQIGT